MGKGAEIKETDLRHWRLLEQFRERLSQRLQQASPEPADPRRKLVCEDYFSLLLFSLLNPVVKTMRGICRASQFSRVQAEVSHHAVSLGSFSEAQHLFDPELLSEVLRDLIKDRPALFGDERVKGLVRELTSTDATLWRMMPRVSWAMFDYRGNQSIRFHLQYDVFWQIPTDWEVTPAAVCERKVWRKHLRRGSFCVADRYYGHDYHLIGDLRQKEVSFVLRLYNSAHFVEVGEPRALTTADAKEKVVRDVSVRLGKNGDGPQVRLVTIKARGHLFLLITDREDIPAELISVIYRYRWQIELFFKWIKCILNCRHFLAQSPQGVAAQIYCALIAAVLLLAVKQKRPTKREMEAIQFYLLGYISLDELTKALN